MALNDDIKVLSRAGLLEGLSEDQLRLLAFGAETVRLAKGQELYREGAPADCAYVVARGIVTLYHEREDGKPVEAGSAGPGAILGELALIAEMRRLTSAAAETEAELLRLNRILFRRMLEEYPDIAATLHQRISENLSAMLARIGRLAPRFS
jgi:CRP-like cAMP-binding protein